MRFATLLVTLLLTATAATAQTRKPSTRPAAATRPGPGDSGLQVVIKSAKVDYLMLRKLNPSGAYDEMFSDDNLLIIRLEITNKGTKEITYKSFNGTPGSNDDHAALLDSNKKYAALVNFGDLEVKDGLKAATLRPGDTVSDILAFAQPANGAKPATLMLPAKNHGDTGYWRLEVTLDPKEPAK